MRYKEKTNICAFVFLMIGIILTSFGLCHPDTLRSVIVGMGLALLFIPLYSEFV